MKVAFKSDEVKKSTRPKAHVIPISPKEFEKLYRENSKKLLQIAFNVVKNKQVSEGIIQNVFCDLWGRLESLSIDVPFEAYVVRAVKLASLDYVRAKIKKRSVEQEIKIQQPLQVDQTEKQLYAKERLKEVQQWIDRLPKGCRKIFKLRIENEKSTKEIAAALGIAESTVDNQIYKASKYLNMRRKKSFKEFLTVPS